MLISNFALPKHYKDLFEKHQIKMKTVEFDDYQMPNDFQWRLAFYKLRVLDYISHEMDYDCYLGVDTDTYFIGALDELWEECANDMPIIYFLGEKKSAIVREAIIKDYQILRNREAIIPQCGGEFIAGSHKSLQCLSEKIKVIYDSAKMLNFAIDKDSGDEALLSMAVFEMKCMPAHAYIERFWTRKAFYNATFAYKYIPIWHLPAEKDYGLIRVYKLIAEKNICPDIKRAARIFNFPFPNKWNLNMIRYYIYKIFKIS